MKPSTRNYDTRWIGTGRRHNVNVTGKHAMAITAEVTGDLELANDLREFRASGARRVMVAAIRAATREAAKFLKDAAPRSDIKKSIGWRTHRLSSPNRAEAKAGVNVGKRPQRFRLYDKRRLESGELHASDNKRDKKLIKTIQSAQKKGYGSTAVIWQVLGTIRRYTKTGSHRGRISATFSVHKSMQAGQSRIRLAARAAAVKQMEKEFAKG